MNLFEDFNGYENENAVKDNNLEPEKEPHVNDEVKELQKKSNILGDFDGKVFDGRKKWKRKIIPGRMIGNEKSKKKPESDIVNLGTK